MKKIIQLPLTDGEASNRAESCCKIAISYVSCGVWLIFDDLSPYINLKMSNYINAAFIEKV